MAAFPYQAETKITLVYPDLFKIGGYQWIKASVDNKDDELRLSGSGNIGGL